jgi:hypothetical protein
MIHLKRTDCPRNARDELATCGSVREGGPIWASEVRLRDADEGSKVCVSRLRVVCTDVSVLSFVMTLGEEMLWGASKGPDSGRKTVGLAALSWLLGWRELFGASNDWAARKVFFSKGSDSTGLTRGGEVGVACCPTVVGTRSTSGSLLTKGVESKDDRLCVSACLRSKSCRSLCTNAERSIFFFFLDFVFAEGFDASNELF